MKHVTYFEDLKYFKKEHRLKIQGCFKVGDTDAFGVESRVVSFQNTTEATFQNIFLMFFFMFFL